MFQAVLDWFHYISDTFSFIIDIIYYSIVFTLINLFIYATVRIFVLYIHMIKDLAENVRDFIFYPILRLMFKITNLFYFCSDWVFNLMEQRMIKKQQKLEIVKQAVENVTAILEEEILENTYGALIPTEETIERTRLQKAYQVLGLHISASHEMVVNAYKKLIRVYHPDRYANHPKDVVKYITQRYNEIIQAYNLIMKYKGV